MNNNELVDLIHAANHDYDYTCLDGITNEEKTEIISLVREWYKLYAKGTNHLQGTTSKKGVDIDE